MDLQVSLVNIIAIGNIIMVEAKYCPIEIDGDVKYYICPRNEICCTFGCCISSNFHFYQLWYYWLMVILMFLLCSGGTWWYRYWLQEGHYTNPPGPPPPSRAHPRHRTPTTRVSYHAGRNTVVLQQIWKPQRAGPPVGYPTPPPAYSLVENSTSVGQSTASGAANVPVQVAKLKSSPYYQLYGPPPSYDSVITETLAERRQFGANTNGPSVSSDQHGCSLVPDSPSSPDTAEAQSSSRSHHCNDIPSLPK